MPILEIQIVGPISHPDEQSAKEPLAQAIADRAGDILNTRPQGTWLRITRLPIEDYAENGGRDAGVMPVFVAVTMSNPPATDTWAPQAQALTQAIAEACDRPAQNVHILLQPSARGRIAFGGKLVV